MECRIRDAVKASDEERGSMGESMREVDIPAALIALGEVSSELLAHASTRAAKAYVADLLEARKRWQKHPRVAVQQPSEGSA
jgi:hypothetical protein